MWREKIEYQRLDNIGDLRISPELQNWQMGKTGYAEQCENVSQDQIFPFLVLTGKS